MISFNNESIYYDAEKGLEIFVSSSAPEGYSELLDKVIWGTNGPQFQFFTTESKLPYLGESIFFYLKKDNTLTTLFTVCRRELFQGKPTFYGRHFANISKEKGLGSLLTKKAFEFASEHPLFDNHTFFAYIEEKNIKSLRVSEKFPVNICGGFKTFIYNRVFPKGIAEKISYDRFIEHKSLIDRVNKDKLFYPKNIENRGEYWILKRSDETLALIQSFDNHWELKSYPNPLLMTLIKVFSKTPILRRVFNKTMKFISIENFYFKESSYFDELLQGILKEKGLHHAMIHLSEENIYDNALVNELNYGWLYKISGYSKSKCIYFGPNQDEDLSSNENGAIYVSGFDIG